MICKKCGTNAEFLIDDLCADCIILQNNKIEGMGQQIIDFIIESGLVHTDPKTIFIWSANAAEQIEEYIKELLA